MCSPDSINKLYEQALFNANAGDLVAAIENLQLAKELCTENCDKDLAKIYNALGAIFRQKGLYEKATEYFQLARGAALKAKDTTTLVKLCVNAALLNYSMGNAKEGVAHVNRGISLATSLALTNRMPKLLLIKFYILYMMGDYKQAEEVFRELDDLENIRDYRDFAEALLEKSKQRAVNKVNAQNILKSVIEKISDGEIKIIAIEHLLQLLLEELAMYESEEVINEIAKYILYLKNLAEKNQSPKVHIIALNLQAKLAFIQRNWQEAMDILTEALQNIDQIADIRLKQMTLEEIQHMQKTIQQWQTAINANPSIKRKLQHSNAINYMEKVMHTLKRYDTAEET